MRPKTVPCLSESSFGLASSFSLNSLWFYWGQKLTCSCTYFCQQRVQLLPLKAYLSLSGSVFFVAFPEICQGWAPTTEILCSSFSPFSLPPRRTQLLLENIKKCIRICLEVLLKTEFFVLTFPVFICFREVCRQRMWKAALLHVYAVSFYPIPRLYQKDILLQF